MDNIEITIPSRQQMNCSLDFYYQYIGYQVYLASIRNKDKDIIVKLEVE